MQQSQHLASLAHTGRSIAPTSNDVLFGRGKRFQNHPGNLRMRKIIRKYKKIYSVQKGQHKKRLVVENAYNEITSGGARFIKQSEENKNEWVEVMMHEALEKVAHTIRYKPRNAKEGSSSNQDDDDESSADEQPVNMAANTVVLSRDQPASSLVPPSAQLQSSAPAPSPVAYGSQIQMTASHNLNPLLNSNFAQQQQVNQIVPPISLLDVYVNPINRPLLQAGLLSPTAYPQNLLLGGFGNNRYGLNQVTQNANLAALRMTQANNAASQQAMMMAQMQQSVQDDNTQKLRAFPKDNAETEQDAANAKY